MFIRRLVVGAFLACLGANLPAAEKPQTWVEVRSPHFLVISNAGAKQAQRTATQFELFRTVVQKALPKARVESGQPIYVLAVKDEKSLKALLPEFWETKGRMHPAGVFIAGPEKNYVALRLDVEGDRPYQIIYHEYVHYLVRLNLERVPLWLNEGLAEFYGNASLEEKEVGLGRHSEEHLQLLRERSRIPLEKLLTADHRSPFYNENNKASVFYAQAWAMTHYLVIGDGGAHAKQLTEYLSLVQQNMSGMDAARQAFGDLKKFEKTMDDYTRLPAYYYLKMKSPLDTQEKDLQTRELLAAESAARRGDFHVHMNRPADARPLLQEALRLDPQLALAAESMGMLLMREGKQEEAQQWFARAVGNDSKSFLAHYFQAMLATKGALSAESIALAEKGLRRSIELNSDFAPAYSTLAVFLMMRGERLDEALSLARRAAALEPGTLLHHLNVASILLRSEKVEDAEKLARRVLAAARSEPDRVAVTQFLDNLAQYKTYLTKQKQQDEEVRSYLEAGKKYKEEAPATAGAEAAPAAKPPEEAPSSSPARVLTAPGEGTVTAAVCRGKVMDLSLALYGFKLAVHSEDYTQLRFSVAQGKLRADFNPCLHLQGKYVKVEYRAQESKAYAGELVSVEINK